MGPRCCCAEKVTYTTVLQSASLSHIMSNHIILSHIISYHFEFYHMFLICLFLAIYRLLFFHSFDISSCFHILTNRLEKRVIVPLPVAEAREQMIRKNLFGRAREDLNYTEVGSEVLSHYIA